MTERYDIWGPSTGSSRIELYRDAHGRVVIHAHTDFGEARCGFKDEQALKIRDALNELLGCRT